MFDVAESQRRTLGICQAIGEPVKVTQSEDSEILPDGVFLRFDFPDGFHVIVPIKNLEDSEQMTILINTVKKERADALAKKT
ncbi:MAG TPA: hypothetical protein VFM05_03835 [Candidatus Saccharimonadales bacterium]|nr:hypothetical protein [Candidatus Saccharimonadales bacterium]